MKRFKKLLVATDTRLNEYSVVDEAADLFLANAALLTIVDVVPASSWIAEFVTSDGLASMRELYAQEAKRKIESLAAPLRDRGLDITTRVLTGRTSVEVIRDVLREKHDLVLAVARGKNSKRKGFFGSTAQHLLRNCPAPFGW